ncbi:hypothetical protein FHX82_000671 [Amycolatopsis bartoniae]|uniref:polysaccharide pyruvyl transferase family protein n=1 Tax=Amycolatopsis bartoniae TaxID=941986 RepID=UPI001815C114|nr:polysaccharide pyruvyl transferase family protein [Amycolatopsis bartoniae]MBB2933651.1 hypothetical protein [Amycolatopsis bartoniae]
MITAPNLGWVNAGMVTVDLAFEAMRKRMGGGVQADWYSLHPAEVRSFRRDVRPEDLPFCSSSVIDRLQEIYEHDAVIFWGDFLHARHYLEQDAIINLKLHGHLNDLGAMRSLLHQTMLFRDASDDVLSKTLLYGGTLLHNSQSDYADEGYCSAFSRLITQANAVWVRDPLSAAKVKHWRQNSAIDHFGTDAAMLLQPGDLDLLPTTGWADEIPKEEVAGVFLGNRTRVPRWFYRFAQGLANQTGTQLEWLPWYDSPRFRTRHMNTRPEKERTLGDVFAALSRYKFIVTDTYHLCVNSWRAGTPAICIGSPQPANDSLEGLLTLNDLKKYVFYSAYDAADFFVSTSESSHRARAGHFDRLLQLLEGGFEPVVHRMQLHAKRSAGSFEKTLRGLL